MTGHPDSIATVEAVAARRWRSNSSVRLVTAIEPVLVATPGFDVDVDKVHASLGSAAESLRKSGMQVSTETRVADAKTMLLEIAEK